MLAAEGAIELIILIISVTGIVVSLLFVAFWRYSTRVQKLQTAAVMVSDFSSRHVELEERVRMVEYSAVGYVNSIGKDGANLLEELQKRINQSAYLLEELESLLVTGDSSAAKEVEMFFCNDHPRQISPEVSFDGTPRLLRFDPQWDAQIEEILQKLGGTVSQASIAATAIGIPKSRKRKSTLMNLLDAGIDLISLKNKGE